MVKMIIPLKRKCFIGLMMTAMLLYGYFYATAVNNVTSNVINTATKDRTSDAVNSTWSETYDIKQNISTLSPSENNATEITTDTLTLSQIVDFVVNKPGCKIPKLDPMHSTVQHFIEHLPDLQCRGACLVKVENNSLRVTKHVFTDNSGCFVRTIVRKNEDNSELGNEIRIENGILNVTSEHVQVECKTGNTITYRNFYPFVLRKKSVEKRIQIYRENLQNSQNAEKFRLILLGLDSVSKNQFLRHMLRTHEFIKRKLTFVELHGYNKIGKNTYANIIPLFTGKLESEIPDTSIQPADALPFIWKKFAENGYRTQFSEDLPQGAIFNYGRKGFTEPPVDYYLRPWSLAVEPYIKKWKTGCINERIEADVILKYMEDLFNLFPTDPLFAFTFLTRMSHDYINQLSFHDKPIRDFLERLYLKGHFNNTIMFFFGDHGFRFGGIRSTYIGRMEGRLPFMFILVPPWFPKIYPQMYKNLKTNERNLVSPLDIYATLKDLLHFEGKGTEDDGKGRSVSLLKYSVPGNRTCEEAAILNQFCSCVKSEPVSLDDGRVNLSAVEIVRKINDITEDYRTQCAKLSLVSILSASKQDVNLEESSHDGFTNFLITVKVAPSEGIFEGSVWYNGKNSYSADNSVERINLYGNQSACVDQNVLKPYCYCVG